MTRAIFLSSVAVVLSLLLSACGPKVGSPEWCEMMDEKPKGEWTANEAGDYTANCIIREEEG